MEYVFHSDNSVTIVVYIPDLSFSPASTEKKCIVRQVIMTFIK